MKRRKQIAAFWAAGILLASSMPFNVLAAEKQYGEGLCEHHPQHTEACGYSEGTEGTPCVHEHTKDCYEWIEKCIHEHTQECRPDESISGNAADFSEQDGNAPDGCTHVCSEESGCVKKELVCDHEKNGHDEACGYAEGNSGTSCTYVCKICMQQDEEGDGSGEKAGEDAKTTDEQAGEVQKLLKALPSVEELEGMDADGQREAYKRILEIYEAYEELSEEQKKAVSGAELLEELLSWFSGMTEENAIYPSGDREYLIGGQEFKPDTYYLLDAADSSKLTENGASEDNYHFYLDSQTSTLTLKDLRLDNYILIPGGITVNLVGENELTESSATIQTLTEGDLVIGGDGSLKINGGGSEELCLTETGNLVIKDGAAIELYGIGTNGAAVSIKNGTLEITDNAALTVFSGNVSGGSETGIRGNARIDIRDGGLSASKIVIEGNAAAVVSAQNGVAINGSGGLTITGNASVTAKGSRGGLNAYYGNLTITSSKKVDVAATGIGYAAISMGQGDPSPVLDMKISGEVAVSGDVGIGSTQGNIVVDGASLTIDANRIGITSRHAEADVTIKNGSVVTVTTAASPSNGIASNRNVIVEDSTVEVDGTDKFAFPKKPRCSYSGAYRVLAGESRDTATPFENPEEEVFRNAYVKIFPVTESSGGSDSGASRHEADKEDSEEPEMPAVQIRTGRTETAAGRMDIANGKIAVTATIPAETLNRLVREKAAQYNVTTPAMSFGFAEETLKQLDSLSGNGDIIVRAVQTANPTGELRPAYQFSIVYRVNGVETPIALPGGKEILVRLPYVAEAGEQPGSVYAVAADAAQKAVWMTRSGYNESLSLVSFPLTAAGVYGVGYHTLGEGFTDIAGHWAVQDIIFTAGRSILAGTDKNTFSPDMALTWRMLPGELWKITGNAQDSPVSREQFAVLLQSYAVQSGKKLPQIRKPVIFADEAEISRSARAAVKAVQQAGVMPGRSNARFAPKAPITRAEAAAAIRRFIEVMVDPQNVKGWTQNDSGQWSYIHPDGSMAVNTVVDGFQIGADGIKR